MKAYILNIVAWFITLFFVPMDRSGFTLASIVVGNILVAAFCGSITGLVTILILKLAGKDELTW